MQIVHILLNYIGNIFKLCEFMTIMFGKHALGTNDWVTYFAEVFDFLILMLETENFPCGGVGNGATCTINDIFILLLLELLLLLLLLLGVAHTYGVCVIVFVVIRSHIAITCSSILMKLLHFTILTDWEKHSTSYYWAPVSTRGSWVAYH